MQQHNIIRDIPNHEEKRIGRGGKRGTYSGRGIKGQRARAGARIRPEMRDALKRIPKLRGYKFNAFRTRPAIVNLGDIDRHFAIGAIVSPKSLLREGLVRRANGRVPTVKILGKGALTKKIVFQDVSFSKSAEKLIQL